jgi:hypothetical protein
LRCDCSECFYFCSMEKLGFKKVITIGNSRQGERSGESGGNLGT